MTDKELKILLDDLIAGLKKRDEKFIASGIYDFSTGSGASEAQIADLEKHWSVKLPPLYKKLLGFYNGIGSFYNGTPLLSTQEIISHSAKQVKMLQVFVFRDLQHEYFYFDFDQRNSNGDVPIVAAQSNYIFASLDSFLREYLTIVQKFVADKNQEN